MTDELLPPPPPGMDARVDHEGVTWAIGVHHGQLTGGVLAIAVGLVGVAAGLAVGTAFGPWIAALGLVIAAIGATVATQATRTTEVQLRARTVTVTKRSGWPRAVTRQAVRIDDLTAVRVGSAVAVETRDDAVVFGAHTPRAHLDWFGTALAHARAREAERERREGREWGFLRTTPEALDELRR